MIRHAGLALHRTGSIEQPAPGLGPPRSIRHAPNSWPGTHWRSIAALRCRERHPTGWFGGFPTGRPWVSHPGPHSLGSRPSRRPLFTGRLAGVGPDVPRRCERLSWRRGSSRSATLTRIARRAASRLLARVASSLAAGPRRARGCLLRTGFREPDSVIGSFPIPPVGTPSDGIFTV